MYLLKVASLKQPKCNNVYKGKLSSNIQEILVQEGCC